MIEADELDWRRELAQRGEAALADAFAEQRDRLRKLLQFRWPAALSARVEVEDVMQEVWLAARQRLEHFLTHPQLSLFVWLRMLANQTLVDCERRYLGTQKRDVFRETQIPAAGLKEGTSVSLARFLIGNLTSPSQALEQRERAEQLRQALEGMDEIDREVLALRHFEELSNSETAEVLGIQPKAASIRYVRAVRRLKEILDGLSFFGSA